MNFDDKNVQNIYLEKVILKQCKFAIFEVTIETGWMSEFRDAYHYHVICLCLYDKRKWAEWKIKKMSQMVTSDKLFKENNFGYLNMREMQTAVGAFFGLIMDFDDLLRQPHGTLH